MKILFAVLSWGLGHATRSLPIIKELVKTNHEVTILSHGRALKFLKKELGKKCKYIDKHDYPLPYTNTGLFVLKTTIYLPAIWACMNYESKVLKSLLKRHKYDAIISDGRYGISSKKIPSYLIFHQLRLIFPGRARWAEFLMTWYNHMFFKKFEKIIIPDYEDENNLSGDLSHNLIFYKKEQLEYAGLLTDVEKKSIKENIDYFISISGPEPQRTAFEKKILKQAKDLKGKIVITLGKPEDSSVKKLRSGKDEITVYGHLTREQMIDNFNRAKLVISRSGYTTMMELAYLGKKALYIPTPGQTEQVYLSDYHMKKGNYFSVKESKLDLKRDVEKAKNYKGFKRNVDVKKNVERVMEIIRA